MQRSAAAKCEPATPSLEYATVMSRPADGAWLLRASFGEVEAGRAASCLLVPQPGDEVLACLDMAGGAYILAVLRQAEGQGAEIELAGPASVRVAGGDLTLAAPGVVALHGGEGIGLATERLDVKVSRAEAVIDRLDCLCRRVGLRSGSIKAVARACESVFERLTQRLGDSFRYVRDLDETQAGSKRVLAEETLTMHAKTAMVVAEEHVTVNAEQINLG